MNVRAVAAAGLILAADSLLAWNITGHKVISFLAYSHLNQKARARVDAILQAHPDYGSLFSKGTSTSAWDVRRNAFVNASAWPDVIRNDPRFSDEAGAPAPAGFATARKHGDWHYTNTPYPAEFADVKQPAVNAVTQLATLLESLNRSGPVTAEEAYALPWILHIVADLHQPLHAMSRYRRVNGQPEHDAGGNRCYLSNSRNLHGYWDGLLGRDDSEGNVARLAASLGDQTPAPQRQNVNPQDWIGEALALVPSHVYNLPGNCEDKNAPVEPGPEYGIRAVHTARARAALAAYRLAEILNAKLGR